MKKTIVSILFASVIILPFAPHLAEALAFDFGGLKSRMSDFSERVSQHSSKSQPLTPTPSQPQQPQKNPGRPAPGAPSYVPPQQTQPSQPSPAIPAQPNPSTAKKGLISLTFDDGWQSVYHNAIPILEKANLKSTHFIITKTLFGGYNDYMTIDQVLEIQRLGHEIGSHTVSHFDLTKISEQDIRLELKNSKQDLLNIGVNSVKSLAYPFGTYNEKVVELAKNEGYFSARTAWDGFNGFASEQYILKSYVVKYDTSIDDVKKWIDESVTQDKWLILAFHEISTIRRDDYAVTPEKLQSIVDYISSKNTKVVTIAEGTSLLNF